jgi:cell division protease FtsH
MDKEVEKISHAAFDRAVDVLASNRNALDRIAALLLEKDQVSGEEVEQAVREGKVQNGKAQVGKAQKGKEQKGESG